MLNFDQIDKVIKMALEEDMPFGDITTENITKIQNEGVSERQKISQKGTEMIADLKRKLYFTDESSGKTYVGELKIINGKPSLEYKESV